MKEEEMEREMVMGGSNHALLNHQNNHHLTHQPFCREGSPSGPGSQSGNTSPVGGDPLRYEACWRMMDELGLLDRLRIMHVNEGEESGVRQPGGASADQFGVGYDGGVERRGYFDEERGMFRRSVLDEKRENMVGQQQHCLVGSNLLDSPVVARRPDSLMLHSSGLFAGQGSYPYGESMMGKVKPCSNGCLGQNSYRRDATSLIRWPSTNESYPQPQNVGNRNYGLLDTGRSLQGVLANQHCGVGGQNIRMSTLLNGLAPHSLTWNLRNREALECEGSFILEGKELNCVGSKKRRQFSDRLHMRGAHLEFDSMRGAEPNNPPSLPPEYDNLMDMEGYIYYMAKDQHGCRFLQRKFDEGKPAEVEAIFNAIIDHVVELMVNPFGNYFMQKLLDICSEEQRTRILVVLTRDPTDLVRISLNTHGTRAVQKLIETLKTQQQIALAVSSLKPGFLDLIKDLNGNHVVQCCLQSLSTDDNWFIFDAAAKHCVDIATHRHGCCVLQRCIAHSTGEYRANLVAQISANGLLLAQDAFGNYVVQYILELENPSATANLASQLKGNYVLLSMQKFSSNVVEKCIKVFREEDQAKIIVELLSAAQFEQLLQDPYANYVIQSALANTKGYLHSALIEAIRPHAALLRTSPYCKRLSRALLKK